MSEPDKRDRKTRYAALCESDTAISIFQQPWWLDATCGSANWDVVLVESGEEIRASLTYWKGKKFLFETLSQPALTPFLGPWLRETSAKQSDIYSQQIALMASLIEQLPPHHYYIQNWHPRIENWLPFFWRGFTQTTRYTYVLNDLNDTNKLWSQLQGKVRTEIKKAEGRSGIVVVDGSLDEMYALVQLTFTRQGKKPPFSKNYLESIDKACTQRSCRKILIAKDNDGRPHAGAYIVWDADSAYYLVGGGDPEVRNSGAATLCLWKAIQFASTVSHQFDFEGSIMEPIERFFRSFGAKQTPYFTVQRAEPAILKCLLFIRDLRDGFKLKQSPALRKPSEGSTIDAAVQATRSKR